MPKRLELLHHFLRQYYIAVKMLKMYKNTKKYLQLGLLRHFSKKKKPRGFQKTAWLGLLLKY